jgi:hypothetical protein
MNKMILPKNRSLYSRKRFVVYFFDSLLVLLKNCFASSRGEIGEITISFFLYNFH